MEIVRPVSGDGAGGGRIVKGTGDGGRPTGETCPVMRPGHECRISRSGTLGGLGQTEGQLFRRRAALCCPLAFPMRKDRPRFLADLWKATLIRSKRQSKVLHNAPMSRAPSSIWTWRIITDDHQDSSVVRDPRRGMAQDRNRPGPRGFDQRVGRGLRSTEERRVGKECVSTGRSRVWPEL